MARRAVYQVTRTPSVVARFGSRLVQYLDAANTSASFTDLGATTIARPTQNVFVWADPSQYSNNVRQTTASRRPTLSTGGFGGRLSLFFDGGDQLETPSNLIGLNGSAKWEAWIYEQSTGISANQIVFEYSNNSAATVGSFGHLLFLSGNWSHLGTGNAGVGQINRSGLNLAANLLRFTGNFGLATNEIDLFLNGSNVGNTRVTNPNSTGTLGLFRMFIGARFSPVSFYTGYIRRIMIFNDSLTPAEVTFMNTFMVT